MTADSVTQSLDRDGNTNLDMRPTLQEEVSAAKHVPLRLPADLCPTLGERFNPRVCEDWVIGAHIVNFMRLYHEPPCMTQLKRLSGRSHAHLSVTVDRLRARGWIGGAKVPHKYGEGQFGKRWRFWVPEGSPLRKLLDAKKGDKFRWIAVPWHVARCRSVLAVGAYLALHEQMQRDGAIATTPTDLAALLSCDRTTAWRILRFVGAKPVTEPRVGHVLYHMPLVYSQSLTLMEYGPRHLMLVPGHLRDKMQERLDKISNILNGLGVDATRELQEVMEELGELPKTPSAALVLRMLEERNRWVLSGHKMYRHVLAMRFGSRLKGLRRDTKAAFHEDAPDRYLIRSDVRSSLSRAICDERGCEDGWIDVPQNDGTNAARRCPSCST